MYQQDFTAAPAQRPWPARAHNQAAREQQHGWIAVSSAAGGRYVNGSDVHWQVFTHTDGDGGEAGRAVCGLRYGQPALNIMLRSFDRLPRRLHDVAVGGYEGPPLPSAMVAFEADELSCAQSQLRRMQGKLLPACYRRKFCRAIAAGLPLRAGAGIAYLGTVSGKIDSSFRRHRFALASGSHCELDLPADARLYLIPCGDAEDASAVSHAPAGACFGRAMGELPSGSWHKLPWQQQWRTLPQVCGGYVKLDRLLQLWLWMQIVRVPQRPDLAFLPASLVGGLPQIRPSELWWDFGEQRSRPGAAGHLRIVRLQVPFNQQPLRLSIGDGIDLTINRPPLPEPSHVHPRSTSRSRRTAAA